MNGSALLAGDELMKAAAEQVIRSLACLIHGITWMFSGPLGCSQAVETHCTARISVGHRLKSNYAGSGRLGVRFRTAIISPVMF